MRETIIAMGMEIYGSKNNEGRKSYITPYYFDEKIKNSPSEFEICIYCKELNKEFRYGFSINGREVLEEWLFSKTFSKTPTVKEKCVFYRQKKSEKCVK